MHIRTYTLPDCWLHEHSNYIHTVYVKDRSECVFAPPLNQDGVIETDFLLAANEMGYSDPMRYAVEHEIAHHITALERSLPHSVVVWKAAHNEPMTDDPECDQEEHLANRLQLYMNTGELDSHGLLEHHYGKRLPQIAVKLLMIARPWLLIT